MSKPSIWALLPAAGSGSRMGSPIKKQFLILPDGREILTHSIQLFEDCSRISGILIVTGNEDIPQCQELVRKYRFTKVRQIVEGGATRQESVLHGLLALPECCEYVAIHDAARPYLTVADLNAVLDDALSYGASVMAVPSKDTIKRSDANGFVVETPNRSTLWNIQTPQVFERKLILEAHRAAAKRGNFFCTDDAQIIEMYAHHPVHLCSGSYSNIKITTPEDLPGYTPSTL